MTKDVDAAATAATDTSMGDNSDLTLADEADHIDDLLGEDETQPARGEGADDPSAWAVIFKALPHGYWQFRIGSKTGPMVADGYEPEKLRALAKAITVACTAPAEARALDAERRAKEHAIAAKAAVGVGEAAVERERAAEARAREAAHPSKVHAEREAMLEAARQAGREELGREVESGLVMLGMRPGSNDPLDLVAAVGRALGERREEGRRHGLALVVQALHNEAKEAIERNGDRQLAGHLGLAARIAAAVPAPKSPPEATLHIQGDPKPETAAVLAATVQAAYPHPAPASNGTPVPAWTPADEERVEVLQREWASGLVEPTRPEASPMGGTPDGHVWKAGACERCSFMENAAPRECPGGWSSAAPAPPAAPRGDALRRLLAGEPVPEIDALEPDDGIFATQPATPAAAPTEPVTREDEDDAQGQHEDEEGVRGRRDGGSAVHHQGAPRSAKRDGVDGDAGGRGAEASALGGAALAPAAAAPQGAAPGLTPAEAGIAILARDAGLPKGTLAHQVVAHYRTLVAPSAPRAEVPDAAPGVHAIGLDTPAPLHRVLDKLTEGVGLLLDGLGWDGHYTVDGSGDHNDSYFREAMRAGLAYLRGEPVTHETLTIPAHPDAADAYSTPAARHRTPKGGLDVATIGSLVGEARAALDATIDRDRRLCDARLALDTALEMLDEPAAASHPHGERPACKGCSKPGHRCTVPAQPAYDPKVGDPVVVTARGRVGALGAGIAPVLVDVQRNGGTIGLWFAASDVRPTSDEPGSKDAIARANERWGAVLLGATVTAIDAGANTITVRGLDGIERTMQLGIRGGHD